MAKVLKNKKMGRPRLKIDMRVVEKLGAMMCTYSECAGWLEVKEETLKKRDDFILAYKMGFEKGKMSIRREQFRWMKKSAQMAMFLGKVYLHQREQDTVDHQNMDEYFKEIARAIRDTDG